MDPHVAIDIPQSTILDALPFMLLGGAIISYFAGELLVSGVCFLALSMAIYYREKLQ